MTVDVLNHRLSPPFRAFQAARASKPRREGPASQGVSSLELHDLTDDIAVLRTLPKRFIYYPEKLVDGERDKEWRD